MCRRSVLLVSLGLWVTFVVSGSAQSSGSGNAQSLAARQRWARFVVTRGLVTAIMPHGQNATLSSGGPDEPRQEQFGIFCQSGVTTIRYERRTSNDLLQVVFSAPQQLMIERVPQGEGGPQHLTFHQSSRGLTLTLVDHDGEQRYAAPTLWHLVLAHPQAGRALTEVLEQLRPDWGLAAQVERLEQQLLEDHRTGPRPQVERWVAELADGRFAVRQAADRELRLLGHSLLPLLDQLDETRLNSEQKRRLAAITQRLERGTEDTPAYAAAWLANDQRIWRAWEDSSQPRARLAAEHHLAWLSGELAPRAELAKAPSLDDPTTLR